MLLLNHLWIILALPLAGAAINGLFGKRWPQSAVNSVAIGSVVLSFLAAAETVREFLELLDFRLLIFVGGKMLLLAGETLLDIGVVVAAIAVDLLVPNLEDIIDERVEKRAIVRNHQDRAGVILEIILEPA